MSDDTDDFELDLPSASDPEESLDAIREAALRAGLADYELSEDDLAALADDSSNNARPSRSSRSWGGRTSASRRSSTASR